MDKRALRKEYKQRRTPTGIFAVRCPASGEVWVGSSTHIDTARNSLWAQLRGGSFLMNKHLQDAWTRHGGGDAFQFEILETLDDDIPALSLPDVLRERRSHWAAQLNAGTL